MLIAGSQLVLHANIMLSNKSVESHWPNLRGWVHVNHHGGDLVREPRLYACLG